MENYKTNLSDKQATVYAEVHETLEAKKPTIRKWQRSPLQGTNANWHLVVRSGRSEAAQLKESLLEIIQTIEGAISAAYSEEGKNVTAHLRLLHTYFSELNVAAIENKKKFLLIPLGEYFMGELQEQLKALQS